MEFYQLKFCEQTYLPYFCINLCVPDEEAIISYHSIIDKFFA